MSKSESSARMNVEFIKDEPSNVDFFGSHSRIATAVSEVISEDKGINSIGLLGNWGSGKSTVVNQIQKELESANADIHFFIYDAWLYQSDPPRRAFLETLIQDLVKNSLSEETQWQRRLADLSGRSEETVTETARQLSPSGKWILGSVGIVPFGTILLDRALSHQNIADELWSLLLGAIMSIAPFIMAALLYLWWRPWRQCGSLKEFFTTHREPYTDQSIFALLINQSTERAEKVTKISPEPTVTEFRSVFRDILKGLRKHKERLVIVIDNLDRLSAAEAIELWATIRSLFLGGSLTEGQLSELSRPIIILPIDDTSVQRIFGTSETEVTKQLAQSFIDKTFDISFYVNDPVTSDWRAFLKEKLEQAFGSIVTEERIYWATKLYEEFISGHIPAKRVTPRSIVKLVNSIGVLVKQWNDDSINFISVTFFVLHRSAIREDILKFIKQNWPNADTAVRDWRHDIAALHYGVPKDVAFQILLREPLKLAIGANDKSAFSSLSEVAGFGPIFEEVIDQPPFGASSSGPDPNFIANAALLIAGCGHHDTVMVEKVIKDLVEKWHQCENMNEFRADFAEIVIVMAQFAQDHSFLETSAQQLGISLSKTEISDENAQSFAAALDAIEQNSSPKAGPVTPLTLGYSDLFSLLERVPQKLHPMISTDKSTTNLVAELVKWLGQENEVNRIANIVEYLTSTTPIQSQDRLKPSWDILVQNAASIVQNNPISHYATGPAVDILGVLHRKEQIANDNTKQLSNNGSLSNRLNEADTAQDSSKLGNVAALMFLNNSDFSAPNGKSWEQIDNEHSGFINIFSRALIRYTGNKQLATTVHLGLSAHPSLEAVIKKIIIDDIKSNNAKGISTKHLLQNMAVLRTLVGADLIDTALAQLTKRTDFWTELEKVKAEDAFSTAVAALSKVSGVDIEKLARAVKSRLTGLDSTDWFEIIEEHVILYDLVETFVNISNNKVDLGESLKTALSEFVINMPQSKDGQRKRWFFLIQLISKSLRATIFKNLRDKILSGTDFSQLEELMGYGESQFLEEGKFDQSADSTTRHIIIPLLKKERGLIYIAKNIDFFRKCFINSDDDTRAALLETMNTVEAEFGDIEDDEIKNAVETVKSQFSKTHKARKK